MRELKIVIPAIIDYCRYSNSNLGTNRHYFFWTPESKKINLVTKPVFSNDGINSLLADLNYSLLRSIVFKNNADKLWLATFSRPAYPKINILLET